MLCVARVQTQLDSHVKPTNSNESIKEIVMLAQLDHPNIVRFEAYSTTPVPVILFGYCSGGTFLDAIDRREFESRKRALDVMIDVASGLLYLHSMEPRPMIHRDIKIENILLTSEENGQAQICESNEFIEIRDRGGENYGMNVDRADASSSSPLHFLSR